ncbi:hypothetical protein Abr02nite_82020 [Paractinoplanes brasiliensis]|nr:hypothetical protein Abr02nite_82020 [Actinoplanes brasiliensis]
MRLFRYTGTSDSTTDPQNAKHFTAGPWLFTISAIRKNFAALASAGASRREQGGIALFVHLARVRILSPDEAQMAGRRCRSGGLAI